MVRTAQQQQQQQQQQHGAAGARAVHGATMYYYSEGYPRSLTSKGFTGLIPVGRVGQPEEQLAAPGPPLFESHQVTIADARSSHEDGLRHWRFDVHGFCFAPAPPWDDPSPDRFRVPKRVYTEFGPSLEATMRRSTGAARVFLMSHLVRTEDAGTPSYARLAHADYGPEYETMLRETLVHRYKLPAEEARRCGLCTAGLWQPLDHPAYRDPFCLLDATTLGGDSGDEKTLRFIDADNDLQYGSDQRRPPRERLPAATQSAPALAPVFSPRHRWVFCPDMTPDESVVFKHYDFRPDAADCRSSFHASCSDRFHDGWPECPGRRSLECRILLTFDCEPARL